MIIEFTELNENEKKALEFVSKEEQRIAEIMALNEELISLNARLHKLNARIEIGYYGNWREINYIEPVNTKYSGGLGELRIYYEPNPFTI